MFKDSGVLVLVRLRPLSKLFNNGAGRNSRVDEGCERQVEARDGCDVVLGRGGVLVRLGLRRRLVVKRAKRACKKMVECRRA